MKTIRKLSVILLAMIVSRCAVADDAFVVLRRSSITVLVHCRAECEEHLLT